MSIQAWTQSSAWQCAGWTFLHFLWIGAMIGVAAIASRLVLARADARFRYLAALAWMLILALAPVLIAVRLSRAPAPPLTSPEARTSIALPPVGSRDSAAEPDRIAVPLLTQKRSTEDAHHDHAANPPVRRNWKALIPLLPWAWIAGGMLMLGWSLFGLMGAERLRRCSRPDPGRDFERTCARLGASIRLRRRVNVRICDRAMAPILIGISRPMILLPAGLLSGLTTQQIEMILLHELVHVRRWDNAVNLAQRIVESLLFFQPAVWIVSSWARAEREHCCDDVVTRVCDDRGAYVEALLAAAEGMTRPRLIAATAATGSPLGRRLKRILGVREQLRIGSGMALSIVLVALGGVLCACIAARAAESTQPAVLVVSQKPGAKYATIQSAIDAAPDGATVRIEPGEFVESLSIKKPLTLEGAGWQQTTITIPYDKSGDVAQLAVDAEKQVKEGKLNREVQPALNELAKKLKNPGIKIESAHGVTLRKLKITSNPTGFAVSGRWFFGASLIHVENAEATIRDCAVVGSPGDGIELVGGANATVEHCLVAAAWNTGISVGARTAITAKAHITDCDIRDCYYAGILTGQSDTTIERCRISGAAWHGIRYEDSPVVKNNIIWGNRRCGIYADPNEKGATVEGNLFYRNEWTGIWCLRRNIDRIIGNTFAFNGREAFMASGGAKPEVGRNVFYANATAISVGSVSGDDPEDKLAGAPRLKGNIFWANDVTMVEPAPDGANPTTRATKPAPDTGSIYKDPKYKDPEKGNFSTPPDSPARKADAGADASKLPSFASPWPITPEEKAIIPDGPSRDYQLWKHP